MRVIPFPSPAVHAARDDAPFLDAEPPHWAARGAARLLLALFGVAVGVAVLVRVPETVSARFTLVPIGGTDPVRAPRSGVVTALGAAEGESVKRGDTLLRVRSEEAGDRWAELQTLRLRVAGTDESERNAARQFEAQRRSDEEELRRLTLHAAYLARAVDLKRDELTLARQLAERRAQGVARGVVSADDHLAAQTAAQRTESELEQTRTDLAETQAAIEKTRSEAAARDAAYAEQRRSLDAQRSEASIHVAPLTQALERSAGTDVAIVAPCAGTVVRLRVRGADALVHEGDVLAELACAGARLRADLALPPDGLPLVRRGQRVTLLYDAFPYQRYGARHGTVWWAGPNGSAPEDSGAFRALVDIDARPIVVHGRPQRLLPGMGGGARVVVGRRSILGYLFEPIRAMHENLSDGDER